jgi:hypothetical protein
MAISHRLIGLGVAGALVAPGCNGSSDLDSSQITIERAVEAQVPEQHAGAADSSPFDRLNYQSLFGDWFPEVDSYEQYDLSAEQCAALALGRFTLGEYGEPAYSLFEIPYSDGSTSVGGEEITSSLVLHGVSQAIFEALDADNDRSIETYNSRHKTAVVEAISAASVMQIAATSIDDFNNLPPEEALEINGTEEDYTIAMLDQAREVTASALTIGCDFLNPRLYNSPLEP